MPQAATLVGNRRRHVDESWPTGPSSSSSDSLPLRGLEQYRLEWLISFVASARYGGVSAAARVLYRSQPRVSSHVAELEQALGVRLFDRSARPVQLTHEGRVLLLRAEEILDALRALSDTAGGASPKELRVVTDRAFAAYADPILATEVARLWPTSRLEMSEGVIPVDLTDGGWDLAITPAHHDVLPFAVNSVALWSEPLVAVLPPDHPLARTGVPLRLSSLTGSALIKQPDHFLGGTSSLRSVDASAQVSAQPETMMMMVRHGMGIGVLSGLAALGVDAAGVVMKPVNDPRCMRNISLSWPQGRFGSDDRLLRLLATRIPQPAWPWADDSFRCAVATG